MEDTDVTDQCPNKTGKRAGRVMGKRTGEERILSYQMVPDRDSKKHHVGTMDPINNKTIHLLNQQFSGNEQERIITDDPKRPAT